MTNLSLDNTAKLSELNVTNLCVQRGSKILLEGLSFGATSGDLIWITGNNGSGKTSILKSLAGLIPIDIGEVNWSHENSSIAYLGHNDGLKGKLTVCENLEFWHAIYRSNMDLEIVMKRVDIWRFQDLEAKKLSAGQSRRVALARLLLKNAKLWLLDEPAAPVDVDGREAITNIIGTHLNAGGIALIATHTQPFKIGPNAQVLHLGAR